MISLQSRDLVSTVKGPLAGIRVVEIAGLGSVTFAAMLFANLGAEVVRVCRPSGAGGTSNPSGDLLAAYRPAVVIDLRTEEGREALLGLCDAADVFLEAMRPGVMERLGIGPDVCAGRNPRLVYARLSGYGREGPMAGAPGHDIDYMAMSGALWLLHDGTQRSMRPKSLIGDFCGGALTLAYGVVCALVERERYGHGQVVETSVLQSMLHLLNASYYSRVHKSQDVEVEERHRRLNRPFYCTYETADHGYIAVGAVEQGFYDQFVSVLGLEGELPDRMDANNWSSIGGRLAEVFLTRTRDEWEEMFAGTDACVAPVLSPDEAPNHPSNIAVGLFSKTTPVPIPEVAPTFLRTPGRRQVEVDDKSLEELLDRWGLTEVQKSAVARSAPVIMN